VEEQGERIREVCLLSSAREFRVARSAEESDLLWKGRKNAFDAVGRVSPTYYVRAEWRLAPRSRRRCSGSAKWGKKYGLAISNISHAGDGNMHPIILVDTRKPGDLEKSQARGVLHFGGWIDHRRAWRRHGEE